MKILAFVDVHGDQLAIENILDLAKAEKPDVLVCAGDLTNFGQGLTKIVKKLKIGIPLLIIPGNHELPSEIRALEERFDFVKCIHLKSLVMDKVLFFGCGGGGLSPFHTPFEQSEKMFSRLLSRFKKKKGFKSVLVIHAPPYNTLLDELHGEHIGVRSIKRFIQNYQPDLVICGHLHENAGKVQKLRKTWLVNPGPYGMILKL